MRETMATISHKGDRTRSKYSVKDLDCLGRECLRLGHYQTRGATLSGSRNTGNTSPCCMTRAYHGCPTPIPEPQKDLLEEKKREGYKASGI